MGRALIYIILIAGLCLSCEYTTTDFYSFENQWEQMLVDFDIEVTDSASGEIRLIDKSENLEGVEWRIFHETEGLEYIFENTLPGDTVTFNVDKIGLFTVELIGKGSTLGDGEFELTAEIRKIRVKSFEITKRPLRFSPVLKKVIFQNFQPIDQYGLFWDVNSGPDVKVEVQFSNPFEIFFLSESVLEDVTNEMLPYTWELTTPRPINDRSTRITFYDIDPPNENLLEEERMFTETFFVLEGMYPDQPGIQEYDLGNIKLAIEWIEN